MFSTVGYQALLLAIGPWGVVGFAALGLLIGIAAGIGYHFWSAKSSNSKIADAKAQSEKIIADANAEAKSLRKDAMLEAKEEQQKLRRELDQEIKERRLEITKSEDRISQREDSLAKREVFINNKETALETKNQQLDNIRKGLEAREQNIQKNELQVATTLEKAQKELERISGLSQEEAKQLVIDSVMVEAKKSAALAAKQIETQAKLEADKKAKNIIALAIQRCAADHTSEISISVVAIPNEDMKGRIIGRVGRNIRALESATGCDLIIDDTPDTVTLSGFDPVRREIARISLEKLIADGRIHPSRIEAVVEKVRKDIDNTIMEAGQQAVDECGIYGMNPELIKILGRLKYRTSYGQNVLNHSLEVSYLAGVMAAELGGDVKLAKRAGLLHDIGKSIDHEYEGTHVEIGVELAKKFKENKEVIHCIAAHHGDIECQTMEAVLVMAADAISSARPGARRESLENYIKRLEKLEEIANSFDGVDSSYAIQAGREIRVIVKPEKIDDASTAYIAREIAQKLENELDYPGQIKVCVVRETRSIDYAK